MLVEKFNAVVVFMKDADEPGMSFGMHLESHPKDTYDEAVAYINEQSRHPDFSFGEVHKHFMKPETVEKLRSNREESAFDEDGEAIDIVEIAEITQEAYESTENETRG